MATEGFDFFAVETTARLLYRLKYSSKICEDSLVERSPSGDFLKFKGLGWLSKSELRHFELLEVLGSFGEEECMCPNCVTPWKCNGPHLPKPCKGAPSCSPQLERYMNSFNFRES